MVIGVPRETTRHEHRVGLTPFAVARLVKQGHAVVVERNAGQDAHFADRDFEREGGRIVYNAEEIYKRADMVCRVSRLSEEDLELLKPGTTLCAFQHLAITPPERVKRLMELETTMIGYEVIRGRGGGLPVLVPFSEMAGQMAIHLAAHHLQTEIGGRGILLGNIPGVPPPVVLILGAGTVGQAAARQAIASGVQVMVMDAGVDKLRAMNREFSGPLVTLLASMGRLARYTAIADVIIGAILIPGERAPYLITEEMVRKMKRGSVIIDVSIDQGGCVETGRPTTLEEPTFIAHDVVHYCVPNMTANIPRTASRALATACLPYLVDLANNGLAGALRADPGLAEGVYMYRGRMVNDGMAKTLGIDAVPLQGLLEREGGSS
jgi:alanine dehydrogenase